MKAKRASAMMRVDPLLLLTGIQTRVEKIILCLYIVVYAVAEPGCVSTRRDDIFIFLYIL